MAELLECRQVSGSVLIQPLCRNFGNFAHPISHAHSNPHWPAWKRKPITPACKVLRSYCRQSPAAPKESMTKGGGSGQPGLRAWGAKNLWVKRSRRSRLMIAT